MRYAPHDYQAYAIDYIETHPVATVFLDKGLGNTSITIKAISSLLIASIWQQRSVGGGRGSSGSGDCTAACSTGYMDG